MLLIYNKVIFIVCKIHIVYEYKKTLKEEHISDFLKQAGIHKEDNENEPEPKPTEFKKDEKIMK